jgi:hypothetical protein
MPRRKPEGGNGNDTAEEPSTASSAGPQLRVQMTGTADEVKRQLGVGTEKPETKPEPTVEDFESFFKLLKNPKFIVKVKRLRPKQWKGVKTAVEVWTSELPLQWEEIRSEVQENAGGGTYKVSVINPEAGGIIDARNFDVDGEPIIQSAEMTPEEKAMFGPQEKDATQVSIDGLDRRAAVTAKLLEVENLEHQLEEARLSRNGKGKKGTDESDSKIFDLDRRLTEAKHQAELESRDRKHAEEMRELKAMIAANSKPAQAAGQSETALLLGQMQKMQESSDKRFGDMMKQMQDDRMNLLVQKIDNLEKRPSKESGGFLDFAESAIKMKKLFGWGAGEGDDDDEEDDPNDDRPWWQKALDRLGDKLTPRVIDKIFDRLDGLETSGKKVDKEDFTKSLEIEMKKAEDEAVRIATERAIKALPLQKEDPPQKKEPVPQVNVMERKIVGAAEPVKPATEERQTEAAPGKSETPLHLVKDPPAAPAGTPAEPMPIAKEICLRVCNVILILERELETRPRQFNWNYEGAWNMLPEAVLEKVCLSKTPAEVFDAFKVEGINVEDLEKMKEKVVSAPRAAAWMSRGISELNVWWKKAEVDPNFDPADEGEEEQEEEGGQL